VHAETANTPSRRYPPQKDRPGFSIHETNLFAATETYIWYKNHLEAVYCVDGTGELEDLDNGVTHEIRPGTFYALDGHERHWLRATTDLRMMCVFSPALTGDEVHDDEGTYPLPPLPPLKTEPDPTPHLRESQSETRRTT
jgi:L-ectoine synthase